jgi:hypothetical protein
MNIGFYGHSSCSYRSKDSLIDLLAAKLDSEIVNIGVRQGSEERVLFELKKTKDLDLAIIFHCPSNFLFLPGCDRDFKIDGKFQSRASYIWNINEIQDMNEKLGFHQEHHKKFIEKFQTINKFVNAMTTLKTFFFDPDLNMNRYYGSLSQIDQYLLAKQINTIHVVSNGLPLPDWFKFQSGIVDQSIPELIEEHKSSSSDWFVNGLTETGNVLIADRLYQLIVDNNFVK